MSMSAVLSIDHVSQTFGSGPTAVQALKPTTLEVQAGGGRVTLTVRGSLPGTRPGASLLQTINHRSEMVQEFRRPDRDRAAGPG